MGTSWKPDGSTPDRFQKRLGITTCCPGATVPEPLYSSIIHALPGSPRNCPASPAAVSPGCAITTMKSSDSYRSCFAAVASLTEPGAEAGGWTEAQALRKLARPIVTVKILFFIRSVPTLRKPGPVLPCL